MKMTHVIHSGRFLPDFDANKIEVEAFIQRKTDGSRVLTRPLRVKMYRVPVGISIDGFLEVPAQCK